MNIYSTSPQSFSEALADIAFNCGFALAKGTLLLEDSRAFIQEMIAWATEFEATHKDQDWIDLDYIETIDKFVEDKIEQYHSDHASFWKP